eukprot:366111-Chlamydomonas_euryale.AAC.19
MIKPPCNPPIHAAVVHISPKNIVNQHVVLNTPMSPNRVLVPARCCLPVRVRVWASKCAGAGGCGPVNVRVRAGAGQ